MLENWTIIGINDNIMTHLNIAMWKSSFDLAKINMLLAEYEQINFIGE